MDNYFYLIERPSFHGGEGKEYLKAYPDDLIRFVDDAKVIVYRVADEPMVITADIHLARKEVSIDKAVDAAEIPSELPIPFDVDEEQ